MKRVLPIILIAFLFVPFLSSSQTVDAGVQTIDSPAPPDDCESNDVYVTVETQANAPLTSVTINWRVNGQVQTPVNWSGFIPSGSSSPQPIFVGNYSFNPGDELLVWTTNPNGGTDDFSSNDSIRYEIPIFQKANLPNRKLLCSGGSLVIDTEVTFAKHTWNTGASSSAITVTSAGQYRVTTEDVVTGCEQRYTVFVAAENPVRLPNGPLEGCDGDDVNLSTNLNLGTFNWSTGESSNTIDVQSSGKYWVEVTDTSGTCTSSDTVDVGFLFPPVAQFSGSIGYLTVAFNNQTTNATDYFWNFGDNATSQDVNPSRRFATDGTYTVTLIASNNCFSDTAVKEFTVDRENSTSVGDIEKNILEFNLYPNPAQDVLNLHLNLSESKTITIEILDLGGRVLKVENLGNLSGQTTEIMNISGFTSGIYLLRVKEGTTVVGLDKFVVK